MALRIGRASNRQLALDWDSRTLRMVLLRARGDGVEVLKAASAPIAPEVQVQDAASLGGFLRDALHRSGIAARHAVVSIPREKVVLNSLSLPPTGDDELPALVQFQMVKELPFGPDEATLDFAAADDDPRAPRTVLVAAVRNDVLDFYREVAAAAGLKLHRIGLRPDANLRAVSTNAPEVREGRTLLVDIGPEMTEIDIIAGGRLSFSRAAGVRFPPRLTEHDAAPQRIDDSRIMSAPLRDVSAQEAIVESVVDELLIEVTRSVEAYRATAAGTSIDRVIVGGATGVEASFAEAVAARFGVPAELFNPARAVDLSPARARELRGFSAALGAAIGEGRPPATRIDFLQPKKPVTRRARRLRKVRLQAAVAVVTALAGYFWFEQAMAGPLRTRRALASKVEALSKEKRDADDFLKRMKSLQAWVDSERVWIDDLLRLTRVFPPSEEMYVLSVQLSDGGPMDLRLRARDQTLAPQLIERIQKLGLYDATLEGSQEQPQRDQFRYTERLKVAFTGAARREAGRGRGDDENASAASQPATRPATRPAATRAGGL